MATHISEFGGCARSLAHLADRDGYLPREGDYPDEFDWGHTDDFTADYDLMGNGYEGYAAERWAERIAACEEAIVEAVAAIAEGRQ